MPDERTISTLPAFQRQAAPASVPPRNEVYSDSFASEIRNALNVPATTVPVDMLSPTVTTGADRIHEALMTTPVNPPSVEVSALDRSWAQPAIPMPDLGGADLAAMQKAMDPEYAAVMDHLNGVNNYQVDGAKKDLSLTSGQMAGLAAVSTGVQTYAALRNISQQEQAAMSDINQQWKGFEFTNRMNREMEQANETLELFKTLDSLRTQGEQIAAGSQQQTFFRDPITGLRV